MAKLSLVKGTTSKIVHVFVPDSSSTVGAGLTGLAYNTASLSAYYLRPGDASPTSISLANPTLGTWTSAGFKEVSSSNMPGVYEFGIPDACLATGANQVVIMFKGAPNMAPVLMEIELTAINNQDSVRSGLTALPNAAAEASGGLATLSAAQASNGTINANVHRWLTGTPNALQSGRVDSYLGAVASGVIAAASFGANALDAVWSTATRTLSAGTNIVLGKGSGITGFNDITAQAVWDALTSALTTTGSIGKWIVDKLDVIVSTRLASASYTAPSTPPTAAAIADAVCDEALSGHTATGTVGAALSAAGNAGDPWETALPGSYAEGTAGALFAKLADAPEDTPVIIIPDPADASQITGYLVARDAQGIALGGVLFEFALVTPATGNVDSYPLAAFRAVSAADGSLAVAHPKGASFKARRNGGAWASYSVPSSGTTFALPRILGAP